MPNAGDTLATGTAQRLVLVTPSLSGGGAERVVQRLAAGFIDAGHSVTVITTTARPDFYQLDDACQRVHVDVTGQPAGKPMALSSVWNVPKGLLQLRRAILNAEPDVVVSFMEHVNVLSALLVGGSTRVVATEHINASEMAPSLVWRLLRRVAYHRLDRLISVSEGVDSCFTWLPSSKRLVILNPVDPQRSNELSSTPSDNPYLVAMGRLTDQKGFDLLIDAFSSISHRHPTWRVLILGEGEERASLQAQIDQLGLTDRVNLAGRQDNPFPTIGAAECFVLSSRAEGFPMVLIEALSCGTPAIAFDCPSGPSEIIVSGENGVLVPALRTDLLASEMDALMNDPGRRKLFASHAAESVAHLQLDRIVAQWAREVFDCTPTPQVSS